MRHGATTILTAVAAAAGLGLLAACDTSVTNPGPTADEFLNRPEAHKAIVVGARRGLADAIGSEGPGGGVVAYWGAAVTFEINPAGSTGSFGIPPRVQVGTLDEQEASFVWSSANRARFVAEDGIRRFNEVGAAPALLAEATLYAGYANRLLGENFCGAVLPTEVDGKLVAGDSTAHTDYFTRAEAHFTSTMTLATTAGRTDLANAAQAGRASVRADLATYGLANWGDAASDAAAIANTFRFTVPYSSQDQNQFNYFFWSNGNSPYRAHTQWGTFAEAYFLANPNDTRMRWRYPTAAEPKTGDAGVQKFIDLVTDGRAPWYPQTKYAATNAAIALSSGWEMRLIEAEAALAGGNADAAVGFMNQRRANLSLTAYNTGISVDSARSLLKLERQIELWLEARRLGDLRRWRLNNVPGATRDGLYIDQDMDPQKINEFGPVETMTTPIPLRTAPERSFCFPIGRAEKETNPNLSRQGG